MSPRIRLAISMIAFAAAQAAGGARAQTATATTTGTTSISAPAAITVTQNLSFTVLPQMINSGLTISSSALNGVNANVQLSGDQAASVSVPASFDVIRVGGEETITVRTVGPVTSVLFDGATRQVLGLANGGPFANPVAVIGTFDKGILSFSVGGQVTMANNLVPGEYQGVLTVIAQYN